MSAPSLVATAGSASANSYVSVSDADAYHDTHLYGSTWFASDTEAKVKGLIWATRMLDDYFEWFGSPSSDTQALRWPRSAAYNADGQQLANDTIPTAIENATAELARKLIEVDRTEDGASTGATGALESLKVGSIELKYASGTVNDIPPIPPQIVAMLKAYGTYQSGTGGAIKMRRA